jgi:tRNA threonylcarbamoyladenosine biosynthesis protein TsaE
MAALDHPGIVGSTVWKLECDTQAFAQRLAAALWVLPQPGHALIELRGNLGAGKTTLARHLLQALGVRGRIKSPTYAVVETYQVGLPTPLAIAHFDLYRFNDPEEWEEAGFRDLFAAPGLKLVEWPDRATGQLPPTDLALDIQSQTSGEDATPAPRQVTLRALSPTGQALLEALV